MATLGSTTIVPSADGKDWTLTVSLDTETGKLTYFVNGSSGRTIYEGSYESVMSGVDATIAAPNNADPVQAQATKDFFLVLKDR